MGGSVLAMEVTMMDQGEFVAGRLRTIWRFLSTSSLMKICWSLDRFRTASLLLFGSACLTQKRAGNMSRLPSLVVLKPVSAEGQALLRLARVSEDSALPIS